MNRNENSIRAALLLFCLISLTGILAINYSFAGSPDAPDATATYQKNNITWDIPTDDRGVAKLGLFGEAEEGEEYPLVHPFSADKYYLRIRNSVRGQIGYSMYLYCENENDIPLEFKVKRTGDMQSIEKNDYPASLKDVQVLTAVNGRIKGNGLQDFEIDWQWKTDTDEKDTEFGNQAVDEDLLYTINVMLVIEDNNIYSSHNASGTARLLHRAYIQGYPEGDVRPEGNITRAEVSAIFARILANYDENAMTDTKTDFSDVPEDKWYSKYISSLRDKDVISGYPDGSFRPDRKITRAEFTAVCVRYAEQGSVFIEPADISFKDFSDDHWGYLFVAKAYAEGWVIGFPDNTLRADQEITRAEAVTIVNRILHRSADRNYVDNHLDSLNYFWDLEDNTYWAYYDIYEAANAHDLINTNEGEKWFQ